MIVQTMRIAHVDIKKQAAQAIRKVERSLITTDPNAQSSSRSLGSFLKINMLAVIAHLNDVLQEVHGRQTLLAKRKVISGLTSLIKEVGPAVSAVAPQVGIRASLMSVRSCFHRPLDYGDSTNNGVDTTALRVCSSSVVHVSDNSIAQGYRATRGTDDSFNCQCLARIVNTCTAACSAID